MSRYTLLRFPSRYRFLRIGGIFHIQWALSNMKFRMCQVPTIDPSVILCATSLLHALSSKSYLPPFILVIVVLYYSPCDLLHNKALYKFFCLVSDPICSLEDSSGWLWIVYGTYSRFQLLSIYLERPSSFFFSRSRSARDGSVSHLTTIRPAFHFRARTKQPLFLSHSLSLSLSHYCCLWPRPFQGNVSAITHRSH